MRTNSRVAFALTAAVTAALIGTPAFAAAPTKDARTSLNARATKGVEAPRHTDTVVLTLRSHKAGVAGEEDHFLVRTRRDNGTAKWSDWQATTATAGATAGKYRIDVTMPAKITKGKKEQYQVKFAADAANHLASSRSQVFTVKAS